MTERRIRCTVERMNYSACGLEIGDYFEVGTDGVTLPPGKKFCYFAIAAALPILNGPIGCNDVDGWLDSGPRVACPDPPENLIMRMRMHSYDARGTDHGASK